MSRLVGWTKPCFYHITFLHGDVDRDSPCRAIDPAFGRGGGDDDYAPFDETTGIIHRLTEQQPGFHMNEATMAVHRLAKQQQGLNTV